MWNGIGMLPPAYGMTVSGPVAIYGMIDPYGMDPYGLATSAKLIAEDPRLAELDGKIKAAIAAMWRSTIFSKQRRNYEKLANDLKRERTELRTQLKRTSAGQKYTERIAKKKSKRDAKLAKKQGLAPAEVLDAAAESDTAVSASLTPEAVAAGGMPSWTPWAIGGAILAVIGVVAYNATRKGGGGGRYTATSSPVPATKAA
jgi:hypothetical protein